MKATRSSMPAAQASSAGSPARSASRSPEDDRFNDEVNELLRTAAEHRERQQKAIADENSAQARVAFEAVVAMARDRKSPAR